MKTLKIGKFLNFCCFRGHFRHSQKSPKIFTNTYRTKLNLRELIIWVTAFKVNINFVLGKFCKKKTFDLYIFLSHMKYGRNIKKTEPILCSTS